MTKTELVNAIKEGLDIPASKAEAALALLGDIAAAELIAGGDVPLPGLGKLKVRKREARQGRNPKTGEAISIPAKQVVAFAPGKEFRAALN